MNVLTVIFLLAVCTCLAVFAKPTYDEHLSDLLTSYIDARDVGSDVTDHDEELLLAFIDALEDSNTDMRQLTSDDDDDDDDDDDERAIEGIVRAIQNGEAATDEQRDLMKRGKFWKKVKSWWQRTKDKAWKIIRKLGKAAACKICGKKRELTVSRRKVDWPKLLKTVACSYCNKSGRR